MSEVFQRCRPFRSERQRLGEDWMVFELSAARVEIPHIIDRPHVIFGHHGAQAFDGRHGRARLVSVLNP